MFICGNGFCVGRLSVVSIAEEGRVQFLRCQGCGERSHCVMCRCGVVMGCIAVSSTFLMETWVCQMCRRQALLTWQVYGEVVQTMHWYNEPQEPSSAQRGVDVPAVFTELDDLVEAGFSAEPEMAQQESPRAGEVRARCREYHRKTGEMSSAGPYTKAVLVFTIDCHPRLGKAERVMRICAMPIRVLERHIPRVCHSITFEMKAHWQTPGTFDPEKERFVLVREYSVAIRLVAPRVQVSELVAR